MNHSPARSLLLSALLIAAPAVAQAPPGACLVEDALFATQGGGCKDLGTSLVWSNRGPVCGCTGAMTWAAALNEGGFDDWRLPTKAELEQVKAHGGLGHLRGVVGTSARWWSSTPSSGKRYPTAWASSFGPGGPLQLNTASGCFAQAVRSSSYGYGGAPPGNPTGKARSHTHVDLLPVGPLSWRAHVVSPAQAGRGYLLVAASPLSGATAFPAGVALGSPLVVLESGHFDALGRAFVQIEWTPSFLVPGTPAVDLVLVVLDPQSLDQAVIPIDTTRML